MKARHGEVLKICYTYPQGGGDGNDMYELTAGMRLLLLGYLLFEC